MKVRELVALLAQQDQDADVVIDHGGVASRTVDRVDGARRAGRVPRDPGAQTATRYEGVAPREEWQRWWVRPSAEPCDVVVLVAEE